MGRPKAWLPFGPERLLQRVVRLVGEVAGTIVVVAAPGQMCPPLPGSVQIVRDPVSGRGPLQGLAAGLAALPGTVPLAFVTATDAPFLRPALIWNLKERLGDHDLVIPIVANQLQPLAAIYRRASVLPAIERLLKQDQLRLLNLTECLSTSFVPESELRLIDPHLVTFRNLNTWVDYEQALIDAGFSIPSNQHSAKL